MANVSTSLTLTTNVTGIRYQANGDLVLDFQLIDSTSGIARSTKSYLLKADGTGVYDAAGGAQISATTPANFLTAATTLKTNADTALTNAAAAGKVTL